MTAAQRVGHGLGAGLLAGMVIGLVEAVLVLSSVNTGEYGALIFGVILYGGVGFLLGALIGPLLALVGGIWPSIRAARLWVLAFLFVADAMAWVVARWRLEHVVFRDHGVPPSWSVGLWVVLGSLSLVGLWLGRVFLTRTPLQILLTLRGVLAASGAMVGLAALFSAGPGVGGLHRELIPSRSAPDGASNVLLVVVDGLRADALGTDTPALQALAAEGVVCEQVRAQSTWMRGAFATLLSGTRPAHHRCLGADDRLASRTLAEVLSQAGFATGAVMNSPDVGRAFGFQRGVDWFVVEQPDRVGRATESAGRLTLFQGMRSLRRHTGRVSTSAGAWYEPADVVIEHALLFIEASRDVGNAWFLVVHLAEPRPPWFAHPDQGRAAGLEPPRDDPDGARALYWGEVASVDAHLGQLFEQMRALGQWDDTVVAVTGGFGVGLGEHGLWGTQPGFYEEQVRVPLVIKLPGAELAGARVPWAVRQLDIAPTLAARAGVPIDADWDGVDVLDGLAVGLIEDMATGERPLGAPAHDTSFLQDAGGVAVSGIVSGAWKYVRVDSPESPRARGLVPELLFDLSNDPDEAENLAGFDGVHQADMSRRMREIMQDAWSR